MKIKITDLKKQLKEYEQKELIELIVEMFKSSKEVQNYLSSKFLGDVAIEGLYQKVKNKIEKQFSSDRALRLAEIKKEITDFQKATNDIKRTADLMLLYVEQGVEYTTSFGYFSESFYSSMVKMFDQVATECDNDEELYNDLSNRIQEVLSMLDDCDWAFSEAIHESYYSIGWVHDEEDDEEW
ncbi:DUF6155 family protein [Niallia endozanthoxylica]|uniref:DUF6155 family protein n=1 Tax=Niallia endozanthoxylica TaxID=2036016 RepID=UPI001CC56F7C|nr:DUF6155 family protein [Niallia endozanthoxylica]